MAKGWFGDSKGHADAGRKGGKASRKRRGSKTSSNRGQSATLSSITDQLMNDD